MRSSMAAGRPRFGRHDHDFRRTARPAPGPGRPRYVVTYVDGMQTARTKAPPWSVMFRRREPQRTPAVCRGGGPCGSAWPNQVRDPGSLERSSVIRRARPRRRTQPSSTTVSRRSRTRLTTSGPFPAVVRPLPASLGAPPSRGHEALSLHPAASRELAALLKAACR